MNTLTNDLGYAVRQLFRSPGFTAVVVLTLALGIGVNAALFTVISGVLLQPLPYPNSSRLMTLGETSADTTSNTNAALPNIRDWRAQSHSFEDIAWYTQRFLNMEKPGGGSEFAINVTASANLFSTLGVQPQLGRTFLPNEDLPGHASVIVVSDYMWRHYFSADPKIIGRNVKIGSDFYTVVGIMPSTFSFPQSNADFPAAWSPYVATKDFEDRGSASLNVIGRLKPAVSESAARAELNTIQGNIAKQYNGEHGADHNLNDRVFVQPYLDTLIGKVRPALLSLTAAVVAVWLIACINVASLLLTRNSGRRREIAIRAALGAAKGRLVRQFLTESLLLALLGGFLGLAFAEGALRLLISSLDSLPRSGNIHLDWRVTLVLLAFSMVSALIFGLVPAMQSASAVPQDALREGTASAGTSRSQRRLRDTLVVGQIALALMLLASAGLLLRSLYSLHHVPLGFAPENLVMAEVSIPHDKYLNRDGANLLYKPLLDRLQQTPGVESAALSTALPLSPEISFTASFKRPGQSASNDGHASFRFVSPGIFKTLGIRIVQGRTFSEADTLGSPTVAVINQAFVRQYFANQDPIGRKLDLGDNGDKSVMRDVTIIGVSEDIHQNGLGDPSQPEFCFSYAQIPPADDMAPIMDMFLSVAVRTRLKPESFIPTLRNIIYQTDPDLVTLNGIRTMQEKIDSSLNSQTLAARLLWIFSGAALLISIAGIYGLLAYNVSQRTREIGVRIALGAQPGDIRGMILCQASWILGIGIAAGAVGALFANRLLRSFLFGVDSSDLLTLLAVAALLALCGFAAALIPARRAASVEPMHALRTE